MLSVLTRLVGFHALDEREALLTAFPFKVIEIKETEDMYVVVAEGCTPESIKRGKKYLKKMGFKKLSKKCVVVCK